MITVNPVIDTKYLNIFYKPSVLLSSTSLIRQTSDYDHVRFQLQQWNQAK